MGKLKVGITIDLNTSLFSSGINQNAIYLAKVYKEMGHTPYLLVSNSYNQEFRGRKELELMGLSDLNIITFAESTKLYLHIAITLGMFIAEDILAAYKLKNPKFKLVFYKCGNEFFLTAEKFLFNAPHRGETKSTNPGKTSPPDQIWSIPQMENTNLSYYSYLAKQKNATVVPFIWDPIVIESYAAATKDSNFKWTPRDTKRIGIMEPNLSMMKHVLHPIISCSFLLDLDEHVDVIKLYGTKQFGENKDLIKHVLQGNKKLLNLIKVDGRYPTVQVLDTDIDVVLSWQLENHLNYLYLDVAWLGWPIVHNALLCRDIGYYYSEHDSNEAAQQMKAAFENHTEAWRDVQRNKILRYTIKNKELIESYRMLTDNLINNTFVKQEYDWKTNSIKPKEVE